MKESTILMRKRSELYLPILIGLILLACIPGMVFGATTHAFDVDYEVLPPKGASDEKILILIRVKHPNPNEPLWAYVTWDSRIMVQRQVDVVVNKIHQNWWDISFLPPKGLCARGEHTIRIRIEDSAGNVEKWPYWTYKITDVVPKLDWFDDLTKKELEKITGPKGDKGAVGPTGPVGPRGEQGDAGPVGPLGPKGNVGNIGPQGEIGPVGPIGLQGEIGPKGERGAVGNLNMFISGATLLMSAAALIIVWRKMD